MGWGNSTVDYGYQTPIGGITRVVDDSETLTLLRRSNDALRHQKRDLLVSRRAWAVVAKNIAQSGKVYTDQELDDLYNKAVKICQQQIKQQGLKYFAENPVMFKI